WVTSFPGNPERGLPTVTGVVLLSDASNGMLRAVFDAGAVTALRTGAAAVLAAEALGRADARTAAVVGAGVNGRAAARTFLARGREVAVWDVDGARAEQAAEELGAEVAASLEEALAAALLVTMTPGHDVLLPAGTRDPGPRDRARRARAPGRARPPAAHPVARAPSRRQGEGAPPCSAPPRVQRPHGDYEPRRPDRRLVARAGRVREQRRDRDEP